MRYRCKKSDYLNVKSVLVNLWYRSCTPVSAQFILSKSVVGITVGVFASKANGQLDSIDDV